MINKDALYVLDLDRTLIDTDLVVRLVEQACEQIGINYDHDKVKALALERRGESFEPLSFIASHSDEHLQEFYKKFFELCSKTKIIFPDAVSLLSKLDENGAATIILTFGPINWQTTKLKAAGLAKRPYIITDNQDKSEVVSDWVMDEGFLPPNDKIPAKNQAILVDDKPQAFKSMPINNLSGILVDRKNHLSERNDLVDGVKIISNLDEIL